MPLQHRYNKLKIERKLLMNVIRMICYCTESSIAQWITLCLVKAQNEIISPISLFNESFGLLPSTR